MTSGQRIRAALEHRTPDRTPIFEYVMHSAVAETFLGRPFATDDAVFQAIIRESGYEAALGQMAKDVLDLAELFGFDMLYVCPVPAAPPPSAAPAPPPAGDDPVENLRAKIEAARQKKPGLRDATLAQFVAVQEEIRRRGLDLPMLVPAYAHGVWTDVDLMQTMLLAPEVAHEHFAQRTRAALGTVEQFLAMGIDQIGVGGDFAGNRPIISAEAYRRFIVPEVCKVVDRIHQGRRGEGVSPSRPEGILPSIASSSSSSSAAAASAAIRKQIAAEETEAEAGGRDAHRTQGQDALATPDATRAYAVNASDGDLWYVIDDFLLGCGVDGYIEIDGQAGMDLRKLKERFGRRITLYGNFDCMQVLCFATPEEVRRHALATIEAGLGDGGHILCANNAITSAVPVRNYVALQQAYREYFGLPKLKAPS